MGRVEAAGVPPVGWPGGGAAPAGVPVGKLAEGVLAAGAVFVVGACANKIGVFVVATSGAVFVAGA